MINLRKNTDQDVDVYTSSLNDIMFFLMLFFIIASTLLNPSMIKVSLPNSQNSQSMHQKEINLTITHDMKYYINNTLVPYGNLEDQLRSELNKNPEAFVILRMDNALTVQNLVDVLSLGNKLNTKMTIATSKSER